MRPVSSLRGRPPHSISTVCLLNMVVSQCVGKDKAAPIAGWRQGRPVQYLQGSAGGLPSPANAQPVDELLIPVLIGRLDVIEQPAALADHLEQPSARMVVLAVRLEMFGQIGDALGQDGDLDLWRAGVAGLGRIFLDEILFALSADR